MSKLKTSFIKIISLLINSIRPLLGPRGACIYKKTCTLYAKEKLETRSIFIAIPLIILRVLSCNPITILYWKIKAKI